jgi:hypothetical protein
MLIPFIMLLPALAGCEALLSLLLPSRTTVVLDNRGDFPVEVTLFTSSNQDIPEVLLTADDDDAEQFTVAAGDRVTFSRDCDDLQAIIIEDADLQVVGQAGPQADTGVLRDGDDFGCGDTITFTLDHSAVLVDFDIAVGVQPRTLGE